VDALLDLAKTLLINYQSAGWGRENDYLDRVEVLTDGGTPPALLNMLKGQFNVTSAWDARGSGTAALVTEEGNAKFLERLQVAQTAFEAAWAADETQDGTAVGMITVCVGLGHPRTEMEKWFQRALTANPDSYAACGAKLNYLYPKWPGEPGDELAFGRQCLRSGNYVAGLPFILVRAQRSRAPQELMKFSQYLGENPVAWADVREYYKHALSKSPADRQLLREYAVWCAGTGHWSAAKKHLKALNGVPAEGVFATLPDFQTFVRQVDFKLKNAPK